MGSRLKAWGWQMLLCLDQLFGCWLRGWFYVWRGGECPDADETLSSFVGRNAVEGKRWALVAERLLDGVFGEGHCRESIE